MDAAQQAAIQAVYTAAGGATLTAAQIAAIAPMVDAGNGAGVAAYLSTGLTALQSTWITDRGLVAAAVAQTGSNALSDSILTKFDAAMVASRSAKAIINRLYTSDQGVDFGEPALAAWFGAQLTAGVFTTQEHDFLVGLGMQPVTIPGMAISDAIHGVA